MAAATEGFIHLSRPLAPSSIGLQSNLAPLGVNIHPQVRIFHFASQTIGYDIAGVLTHLGKL